MIYNKNLNNINKKNSFKFIKGVLRNNKKNCIICFVIIIVGAIFEIMLPQIIKFIVDDVILEKKVKELFIFALIYILFSIINSTIAIFQETIISKIKKQMGIHLKLKVLRKLDTFSGKNCTNIKTGEIINIINGDCELVESYGIDILSEIVINILTAGMAFYFLTTMQIDMLIIIVILQVISIIVQLKFTNLITNRTREIREKAGNLINFIEQYISNIIQNIICKSNRYFYKKYIRNEKEYIRESIILDIIYSIHNMIGILLSNLITIFIYTYGGYKVIKGELTLGQLIAFQQYTWMFIGPCVSILKSNTNISKMYVSLNRIYNFLNETIDIKQNNYGLLINSQINEIEFRDVIFSYDEKMVLDRINFKMCTGMIYAFVGETGCGKSTLSNLIYRLWDVNGGKILINNKDIREYNLKALRNRISIVSQDLYMLDDTIENNLTLGNVNISQEQLKKICDILEIDDFVNCLPKGYQTIIGEKGIKLSGGQKQRIVLGRILLQPTNVLILDEATSAMDNITQSKILNNIRGFYKDKVVIVIAHRLSTIKNVDNIFVMKDGVICEEGTHDMLMDNKGYYYNLISKEA